MSEEMVDPRERALEERSRALFHESVEGLDFAVRSRLTQARHRALEAAARTGQRRGRGLMNALLMPAAGVTAAAVLATALWFGTPLGHRPAAEPQATALEDLDLIASSDGSGDALEMMQEDPDFYAWAEKVASPEPAA